MERRHLLVPFVIFALMAAASCSDGGGEFALVLSHSTLSGVAMYEDKEYASGGFTSNTLYKPVRHAIVEAVDSASGAVLVSGHTDAHGGFSLAFGHLPFASAHVRVISSSTGGGLPEVDVTTGPGGPLHAVAGGDVALAAGGEYPTFVNVPASGPAGGAFNILDIMTAAGQFVNAVGGSMPPPLRAYWYHGSPGTYFSTLDGGIFVLGSVFDTDEYDDDVLLHEYAHFVAQAFSIDNSPGGSHDFLTTDLDLRLSWSEGWSDYFQASAERWLLLEPELSGILSLAPGTQTSWYIDTDSGGVYLALDILGSDPADYRYSSNEIAVAKVLLELENSPLSGPQSVWNVFNTIGDYMLPQEQTTLEAFWDGWVTLEGGSAVANAALSDREIYYMEDAFEAAGDGSPDPMRLLGVNNAAGEEHYLYSDYSPWDTDYIAFNATSPGDYTVETFCMRNGADTYLEVRDSGGLMINSPSDDVFSPGTCIPSMFTQYASRVIANISSPGVYYAVVNTSTAAKPAAPPNFPYAGRYGTYRIRVTGP